MLRCKCIRPVSVNCLFPGSCASKWTHVWEKGGFLRLDSVSPDSCLNGSWNSEGLEKTPRRGWPFHILDALPQVLRCLRLCTVHVFISFRKINLCGVQLSALIFCLSNKGSPTERRKNERRMTEHRMTECRKTQNQMTECRMTERRMTVHRMAKC